MRPRRSVESARGRQAVILGHSHAPHRLTTILAITSTLVTFTIASVAAADNSPSLSRHRFADDWLGADRGQPFTIRVDGRSRLGSSVGIDTIGVSVSALQGNQAPIDLGGLNSPSLDVAAATSNRTGAMPYKLDAPGLPRDVHAASGAHYARLGRSDSHPEGR
jgi:hypothetical protein